MREREPLARVRVLANNEDHEISWAARQQLFAHLRATEGSDSVRGAFHRAGTASIVELDTDEKRRLLNAIYVWASETGARELPQQIVRLEHALATDGGDSYTGDATPTNRTAAPGLETSSRPRQDRGRE